MHRRSNSRACSQGLHVRIFVGYRLYSVANSWQGHEKTIKEVSAHIDLLVEYAFHNGQPLALVLTLASACMSLCDVQLFSYLFGRRFGQGVPS